MAQFLIGCGGITWGQFRKKDPSITEDHVLSEIAKAGYAGAPAGARNDRSPQETLALLAKHGLKPAPGYFSADWWRPEQKQEIFDKLMNQVRYASALGLTELYVAANGFDYVTRSGKTRRQTAGHVRPDDALTDDQYKQFGEVLNLCGRAAVKEGVRLCFHNHVGTPIETRQEMDRLFAMLESDAVFYGIDTGHMAWAGDDVIAFCRDNASRIKTMHLKDINKSIAEQGRSQQWDYGQFSNAGVFAEIGEGFIDFGAVHDILRKSNFNGWLITETDVTQKSSAYESVKISRDHLKSLGV